MRGVPLSGLLQNRLAHVFVRHDIQPQLRIRRLQ
jgi:hypothetical protein